MHEVPDDTTRAQQVALADGEARPPHSRSRALMRWTAVRGQLATVEGRPHALRVAFAPQAKHPFPQRKLVIQLLDLCVQPPFQLSKTCFEPGSCCAEEVALLVQSLQLLRGDGFLFRLLLGDGDNLLVGRHLLVQSGTVSLPCFHVRIPEYPPWLQPLGQDGIRSFVNVSAAHCSVKPSLPHCW